MSECLRTGAGGPRDTDHLSFPTARLTTHKGALGATQSTFIPAPPRVHWADEEKNPHIAGSVSEEQTSPRGSVWLTGLDVHCSASKLLTIVPHCPHPCHCGRWQPLPKQCLLPHKTFHSVTEPGIPGGNFSYHCESTKQLCGLCQCIPLSDPYSDPKHRTLHGDLQHQQGRVTCKTQVPSQALGRVFRIRTGQNSACVSSAQTHFHPGVSLSVGCRSQRPPIVQSRNIFSSLWDKGTGFRVDNLDAPSREPEQQTQVQGGLLRVLQQDLRETLC